MAIAENEAWKNSALDGIRIRASQMIFGLIFLSAWCLSFLANYIWFKVLISFFKQFLLLPRDTKSQDTFQSQ